MNIRSEENLTLLTDFYELTMSYGYFKQEMAQQIGIFDMYFRKNPDQGAFSIACGLETLIEYIEGLHFTEEDLDYLRQRNLFDEEFLELLRNFHFTGDLWAVEEGSVVFPNEPLVIVRAPLIEATLLETMLLLTINHQSMIATKTNRVVRAAQGRLIFEFGSRRAQGPDAANHGAKAAYIAGAAGTANTLADRLYGVPAVGTMAHSWIMMFDSEYEAFKAYAQTYPQSCTLLVDTYDTLRSGVPNAIRVFKEELLPKGYQPAGIRLDSGDIAYLSKEARRMLDEAGLQDIPIIASNSLDEYKIQDILNQKACVDRFGVGESLITSKSSPVFGGVYKLAAAEVDGVLHPKIKISENVEKITTPGFKTFYRFYSKKDKKALADVIALHEEQIDASAPYEIFHPVYTWKRLRLEDFEVRCMLKPIYQKGKLCYKMPSIEERRSYCERELSTLWNEYLRFENPQEYKVDLSIALWNLKHDLLNQTQQNIHSASAE